ncbi:anaphase-promoting complex subunit 15B [Trichogramma pretiosum]|uniref:Anaphase-promoting complex subunit 15 n=1 Tax=Trichogramma kaykai TaxID=54128 RepID=A0ABD2XQ85_9HYME|nr:anaphase-promoting complex subunit 15B [Trichogramma pretiosum]
MSFMPLWPDLQPRATDPLWFNADKPIDDESQVAAMELEFEAWREQIKIEGYEHIPIGKSASDFRGSEEEEEEEEEEEGEGEEEEDSDTHEEEEEELDDIDMEVSYSHPQQRSSPADTSTDQVVIRMEPSGAP